MNYDPNLRRVLERYVSARNSLPYAWDESVRSTLEAVMNLERRRATAYLGVSLSDADLERIVQNLPERYANDFHWTYLQKQSGFPMLTEQATYTPRAISDTLSTADSLTGQLRKTLQYLAHDHDPALTPGPFQSRPQAAETHRPAKPTFTTQTHIGGCTCQECRPAKKKSLPHIPYASETTIYPKPGPAKPISTTQTQLPYKQRAAILAYHASIQPPAPTIESLTEQFVHSEGMLLAEFEERVKPLVDAEWKAYYVDLEKRRAKVGQAKPVKEQCPQSKLKSIIGYSLMVSSLPMLASILFGETTFLVVFTVWLTFNLAAKGAMRMVLH